MCCDETERCLAHLRRGWWMWSRNIAGRRGGKQRILLPGARWSNRQTMPALDNLQEPRTCYGQVSKTEIYDVSSQHHHGSPSSQHTLAMPLRVTRPTVRAFGLSQSYQAKMRMRWVDEELSVLRILRRQAVLLTVSDKADVAKLETRFEAWVTNGLSVALRGWLEIVVEQA